MLDSTNSIIDTTEQLDSSRELHENEFEQLSAALDLDINAHNIAEYVPALERIFNSITPSKLKTLIAIVLMVASSSMVYAQDTSGGYSATTTASGLRVRSTPSTNGDIIEYLAKGKTVQVLNVNNGWAEVSTDDDPEAEGFVSSQYLTGVTENPTQSAPAVIEKNVSYHFSAETCNIGSNGVYQDSGRRLCSLVYGGGTIVYAHNWSNPGKNIYGLFNSAAGTVIDVKVDGVDLGLYEKVKEYEVIGQNIPDLLTDEAKGSQNNEYITLITTNKALEKTYPYARKIVLAKKVS